MAEILLGTINRSGKLAQTWPKKGEYTPVSDTPEHYMCREKGIIKNGRKNVHFSEGIFFGYRWYDKMDIKPRFAFGHGLSYTTFKYSNLNV